MSPATLLRSERLLRALMRRFRGADAITQFKGRLIVEDDLDRALCRLDEEREAMEAREKATRAEAIEERMVGH